MLRVGLALVILTAIFKFEGRSLRVPSRLRWRMWLTGIFSQGLPFSLLFWGERRISAGLAGVLNGPVPPLAVLIGLFLIPVGTFFSRKAGGNLFAPLPPPA